MMRALTSIELTLGEVRRVRFRLRRVSDGGFMPVQDAQWIKVEAWADGEAPLPPVFADKFSGVDDWLTGLVTIPFSPHDVTARARTYSYHMIAKLPGEEPVWEGGRLEVNGRASITAYTLPGVGAFYAANVQAGTARGPIAAGSPIAYDGSSVTPAALTVSGVALTDAADGYTVTFAKKGWVERDDWTPVAGVPLLIPNTVYKLAGVGQISDSSSGVIVGLSDATGRRLTFP